MRTEERFSAFGVVYLRTPVLPHSSGRLPYGDDEPVEDERLLRAVVADPVVREAVEVSSESLATVLRRLDAGAEVSSGQLRRAAYAACRYLLRMSGRPTPFGVLAGVAVGEFAERAEAEIGTAHHKGVRPDGEWFTAVLAVLQRRPEVLRCLRVCANDLVFERAGRFVLPYLGCRGPGTEPAQEQSVRATPPVRAALSAAHAPIECAALLDRITEAFPGAGADRAQALVLGLVEAGLLRTELSATVTAADPMRAALTVLDRTPAPETGQLHRIAGLFADYAAAPLGAGRAAWNAASSAARELHPARATPLQVDLRADARLRLPPIVAREAESAAATLLRLSPPEGAPAHLTQWYYAFVDAYGIGGGVPVKEVLDPERGIGPPAGYRQPPVSRFTVPGAEEDRRWDRLCGELVQQALFSGSGEIVLDEDTMETLAPNGNPAPGPDTAELTFQLLAPSVAAIERGDFRLVCASAMANGTGALFGRFGYLTEGGEPAAVQAGDGNGRLYGQPNFEPTAARHVNILRVDRAVEHTLAFGTFDDRGRPDVLGVEDIGIAADHNGLFVVSLRDGRPITVVCPQMLDTDKHAPNAVRLVRELSRYGTRTLSPWHWGGLDCLPYLPRVRHGRTVLAPARWRPSPGLAEAARNGTDWDAEVARWRKQFGVPDQVQVRESDHGVELDLSRPLHRRLLCDELRRKPELVLVETAHRDESELDWLHGHASEIVVPLRARRGARAETRCAGRRASTRTATPPGGEWLFAKLYSRPERHHELLTAQLPRLLTGVGEPRWFFIRYADPDPHVRLRFHGPAESLNRQLLPRLHDWAAELRTCGLLRKLTIDTYEPEQDRYGGPAVLAAAEHAFGADSAAVLAQLPLLDGPAEPLPPEVLVAVNFVDLLRSMDPDWTDWYRGSAVQHYEGMHRHVRQATELALGLSAAPPGTPAAAIRAACADRAPAIRDYAEALRAEADGERQRGAVDGILHMHHNRLAGIDRETEQRANSVANRVIAAYRGRARAGRA
ncbi:lantibiotic dehydratase [Sciscionella sediminilitoris]|uniref:lantibiotic dehydratase n=1 Tax=Sciscionella sediminilitoris TaxID=1445613 RepID=UPI0004DF1A75|nr:lantibiotic dehydratase [Sciscionella sp. SE31]